LLDATITLVESLNVAADSLAAKSQLLTLQMLRETPEPFSRHQFTPGHVTCTTAVLSPDRTAAALIWHQKLQRWLLPGGHAELSDGSVQAAAAREVFEETGATAGRDFSLVSIDVHGIPARKTEPFHLHHDLLFSAVAESWQLRVSEETPQVIWVPVTEVANRGVDLSTIIAVELAAKLFREAL
jgi:8-oxo-dGTP pyrophosphatase MutT (NUDIX family)